MKKNMIDTGIEWIGTIPAAWRIGRVKNLFYVSKELSRKENPTVLCLARDSVKIRDISNNEGQLAESYDNYNSVQIGDLLLNPMDLYSGANCNVSCVEGVISPAYANLRAKLALNPRFYDYYFKIQYWTMAMFAHGKGVSFDNRWTLNNDSLLNYEVPVLSKEEQEKIVIFLNEKMNRIDELISNQEKQIDKLVNYKKSLISKLVTNGLNPLSKTKVSGLDFVNHIPENWENRKMISILSMRVVDGPHESPELLDSGIPYISATAIVNGKIDFSLMRGYISEKYCDDCDKRYKPQKNDLLVIKLGASTGQVALVDTDERFNIWVPLAAVRCNKLASPKFVFYAFQSDYFIKQMELSWTFGTQQTLGVKTIEKLRIMLPPIDEQISIVNYLDDKINQLDSLLEVKKRKIDSLKEYKKSIIYEYVTGKKEVI